MSTIEHHRQQLHLALRILTAVEEPYLGSEDLDLLGYNGYSSPNLSSLKQEAREILVDSICPETPSSDLMVYRFDFAGGGYITTDHDHAFAVDFAKLVKQYGLPINIAESRPIRNS